jgi:hypothetical protein
LRISLTDLGDWSIYQSLHVTAASFLMSSIISNDLAVV